MYTQRVKPKTSYKRWITGSIALVIVVLIVAGLLLKHHSDKNKVAQTSGDKTTSTSPSAQSDFSSGGNRTPVASSGSQGGSVDTGGQTPPPASPSSTWITSTSGVITVQQPVNNAVVTSGAILGGTSTAPSVQFQLIDDTAGLIAQGELNVVGGKFSGTLQFTSKGKTGRLDVYTLGQSGGEENYIKIPIKFN